MDLEANLMRRRVMESREDFQLLMNFQHFEYYKDAIDYILLSKGSF